MVTRWWTLLYETETPQRVITGDYFLRHCMRRAGDGFALPEVTVVPTGDRVKISWNQVRLPRQRVEFTESGSAYVPIESFEYVVSRFVSAVVERLRENGLEKTLLQADFNSITSTTADEKEFCALAAALGLDPYALEEPESVRVLKVAADVPTDLRLDFFAVADYHNLEIQATQLMEALNVVRQNSAELPSLKTLKQETVASWSTNVEPWRQGYGLARDLRKRLGLNGTRLGSLSKIAEAIGVSQNELDKAIVYRTDIGESVDAVVALNAHDSPAFALVKQQRETSSRFIWCRALCEYLTSPPTVPSLVTEARSERQKRNRAFAAEFLVPGEALQELSPLHPLSEDQIDKFAEDFGVSPWVIKHQLKNQNRAHLLPSEAEWTTD